MTDESQQQNPRVSNADLGRRVERLEDVTAKLSTSVTETNHRLDMVTQNQRHQTEMMDVRFKGMEDLLHSTASETEKITQLIQAAMAGDERVQSPLQKQMMEEYRAFQHKVLSHIDSQDERNEEFDDYILVQKTRSETTRSIASRAFGSSAIAAIAGTVSTIVLILTLLGVIHK